MDKQKEQGLFWLSGNPGEKVDGAITLDDEHGTMLTAAYGQLGLFNLESEEQQVIHGVLTGGHIKLVNCYSTCGPTISERLSESSRPQTKQRGTASSRSAETNTVETCRTELNPLRQTSNCLETGRQGSKGSSEPKTDCR